MKINKLLIKEIAFDEFDLLDKLKKESKFFDLNIDCFSKSCVCFFNEEIVGFINYSIIYDRAELNYIYVSKEYRKKHVATKLMDYFINDAIISECKNITLEVNENNLQAVALYKKFNFDIATIRSGYYGSKDGLLMIRKLDNDEGDIYIRDRN